MKKLPEFVFVTWHDEGDDEWLSASAKSNDAIEDDGPTIVGTYQLVETNKLTKRVISEKHGGK